MSTLQRYWGQFSIGSSTKDFSVNDGGGAQAIELTTGSYYLDGYTSEASDNLCEHITTKLQALGGNFATATCVCSHTTGKVTLDFDGTNVDITWTDTALQSQLGFTGSQSGSSSYTGTNQARYIWLPSMGLSDYPGDRTTWWSPRSSSKIYRSKDGKVYGNQGNEIYDGVFAYENLSKADVITDSSTVWESCEQFFSDVIHRLRPIRVFPDRDLNTSTDYKTGYWTPIDYESGEAVSIGSWQDFRNRATNYNGLWNLAFMLLKDV